VVSGGNVPDLKLFQLSSNGVSEIPSRTAVVEKSLQGLLEGHLESFLGIRFLASEHPTGAVHGGRIDTLGIDENNSPVIIEYKRALNENVINQGLFYLDWLLDHKAEFVLLVQQRLDQTAADQVDWTGPRLLCIAGDFTKYDEHAVQQMGRNIELIRYRMYGDALLALELVNSPAPTMAHRAATPRTASRGEKSAIEALAAAPKELKDRFEGLRAFLLALGDDVQEKHLKNYVAFKRLKNFVCVEPHPKRSEMLLFLKVDPSSVTLEDGFSRDVRAIGHWGTGDLELRVRDDAGLEKAKPLILQSYENG
jgi:predicted transport protein